MRSCAATEALLLFMKVIPSASVAPAAPDRAGETIAGRFADARALAATDAERASIDATQASLTAGARAAALDDGACAGALDDVEGEGAECVLNQVDGGENDDSGGDEAVFERDSGAVTNAGGNGSSQLQP